MHHEALPILEHTQFGEKTIFTINPPTDKSWVGATNLSQGDTIQCGGVKYKVTKVFNRKDSTIGLHTVPA